MVSIAVQRGFGGEILMLDDVDRTLSIAALKGILQEKWAVSACCQQLAIGTTVLEDDKHLASYCCPHGRDASVVMLTSWDQVCRDLAGSDFNARIAGLQNLAQTESPWDEQVTEAVCRCLEIHCQHVRQFGQVQGQAEENAALVREWAVRALKRVICTSDQRIVALICQRLEDREHNVREAAVHALSSIGDNCRELAITIICNLFAHRLYSTRLSALKALTVVAPKGSKSLCAQIVNLLGDPDAFVRQAALETLPLVMSEGDDQIANTVQGCLRDRDRSVRQAAAESLKIMKS